LICPSCDFEGDSQTFSVISKDDGKVKVRCARETCLNEFIGSTAYVCGMGPECRGPVFTSQDAGFGVHQCLSCGTAYHFRCSAAAFGYHLPMCYTCGSDAGQRKFCYDSVSSDPRHQTGEGFAGEPRFEYCTHQLLRYIGEPKAQSWRYPREPVSMKVQKSSVVFAPGHRAPQAGPKIVLPGMSANVPASITLGALLYDCQNTLLRDVFASTGTV
jgi:hypothetical protein